MARQTAGLQKKRTTDKTRQKEETDEEREPPLSECKKTTNQKERNLPSK